MTDSSCAYRQMVLRLPRSLKPPWPLCGAVETRFTFAQALTIAERAVLASSAGRADFKGREVLHVCSSPPSLLHARKRWSHRDRAAQMAAVETWLQRGAAAASIPASSSSAAPQQWLDARLDADTLSIVLSFLPPLDFLAAVQVNRRWHALRSRPLAWPSPLHLCLCVLAKVASVLAMHAHLSNALIDERTLGRLSSALVALLPCQYDGWKGAWLQSTLIACGVVPAYVQLVQHSSPAVFLPALHALRQCADRRLFVRAAATQHKQFDGVLADALPAALASILASCCRHGDADDGGSAAAGGRVVDSNSRSAVTCLDALGVADALMGQSEWKTATPT
jgi:hypothetical protein